MSETMVNLRSRDIASVVPSPRAARGAGFHVSYIHGASAGGIPPSHFRTREQVVAGW